MFPPEVVVERNCGNAPETTLPTFPVGERLLVLYSSTLTSASTEVAKVDVAGSNPVSRSAETESRPPGRLFHFCGLGTLHQCQPRATAIARFAIGREDRKNALVDRALRVGVFVRVQRFDELDHDSRHLLARRDSTSSQRGGSIFRTSHGGSFLSASAVRARYLSSFHASSVL